MILPEASGDQGALQTLHLRSIRWPPLLSDHLEASIHRYLHSRRIPYIDKYDHVQVRMHMFMYVTYTSYDSRMLCQRNLSTHVLSICIYAQML